MSKPSNCRFFLSARRTISGVVLLTAMLAVGNPAVQTLYAASDKVLTHSQIAEANKPGTIMIYTVWTSSISVGAQQIHGKALIEFAENQAKLGLIANNPNAKFKALFDELLNHPLSYLFPSTNNAGNQKKDVAILKIEKDNLPPRFPSGTIQR